jgi:hypothetical protein
MSTWQPGHERGRSVVALGAALTLGAALLDLLATGRVSPLFDVCFVVLCAALAVLVAPRDFYTVGVLPPALMIGVFLLVALGDPGAVGHPRDGLAQAVVTGLARHSVALCLGYALCLALLAQRRRVLGD